MAPVIFQPEEAVSVLSEAILTILSHSSNHAFIQACLTRLQANSLEEAGQRLKHHLWFILHKHRGVDIPPEITEELSILPLQLRSNPVPTLGSGLQFLVQSRQPAQCFQELALPNPSQDGFEDFTSAHPPAEGSAEFLSVRSPQNGYINITGEDAGVEVSKESSQAVGFGHSEYDQSLFFIPHADNQGCNLLKDPVLDCGTSNKHVNDGAQPAFAHYELERSEGVINTRFDLLPGPSTDTPAIKTSVTDNSSQHEGADIAFQEHQNPNEANFHDALGSTQEAVTPHYIQGYQEAYSIIHDNVHSLCTHEQRFTLSPIRLPTFNTRLDSLHEVRDMENVTGFSNAYENEVRNHEEHQPNLSHPKNLINRALSLLSHMTDSNEGLASQQLIDAAMTELSEALSQSFSSQSIPIQPLSLTPPSSSHSLSQSLAIHVGTHEYQHGHKSINLDNEQPVLVASQEHQSISEETVVVEKHEHQKDPNVMNLDNEQSVLVEPHDHSTTQITNSTSEQSTLVNSQENTNLLKVTNPAIEIVLVSSQEYQSADEEPFGESSLCNDDAPNLANPTSEQNVLFASQELQHAAKLTNPTNEKLIKKMAFHDPDKQLVNSLQAQDCTNETEGLSQESVSILKDRPKLNIEENDHSGDRMSQDSSSLEILSQVSDNDVNIEENNQEIPSQISDEIIDVEKDNQDHTISTNVDENQDVKTSTMPNSAEIEIDEPEGNAIVLGNYSSGKPTGKTLNDNTVIRNSIQSSEVIFPNLQAANSSNHTNPSSNQHVSKRRSTEILDGSDNDDDTSPRKRLNSQESSLMAKDIPKLMVINNKPSGSRQVCSESKYNFPKRPNESASPPVCESLKGSSLSPGHELSAEWPHANVCKRIRMTPPDSSNEREPTPELHIDNNQKRNDDMCEKESKYPEPNENQECMQQLSSSLHEKHNMDNIEQTPAGLLSPCRLLKDNFSVHSEPVCNTRKPEHKPEPSLPQPNQQRPKVNFRMVKAKILPVSIIHEEDLISNKSESLSVESQDQSELEDEDSDHDSESLLKDVPLDAIIKKKHSDNLCSLETTQVTNMYQHLQGPENRSVTGNQENIGENTPPDISKDTTTDDINKADKDIHNYCEASRQATKTRKQVPLTPVKENLSQTPEPTSPSLAPLVSAGDNALIDVRPGSEPENMGEFEEEWGQVNRAGNYVNEAASPKATSGGGLQEGTGKLQGGQESVRNKVNEEGEVVARVTQRHQDSSNTIQAHKSQLHYSTENELQEVLSNKSPQQLDETQGQLPTRPHELDQNRIQRVKIQGQQSSTLQKSQQMSNQKEEVRNQIATLQLLKHYDQRDKIHAQQGSSSYESSKHNNKEIEIQEQTILTPKVSFQHYNQEDKIHVQQARSPHKTQHINQEDKIQGKTATASKESLQYYNQGNKRQEKLGDIVSNESMQQYSIRDETQEHLISVSQESLKHLNQEDKEELQGYCKSLKDNSKYDQIQEGLINVLQDSLQHSSQGDAIQGQVASTSHELLQLYSQEGGIQGDQANVSQGSSQYSRKEGGIQDQQARASNDSNLEDEIQGELVNLQQDSLKHTSHTVMKQEKECSITHESLQQINHDKEIPDQLTNIPTESLQGSNQGNGIKETVVGAPHKPQNQHIQEDIIALMLPEYGNNDSLWEDNAKDVPMTRKTILEKNIPIKDISCDVSNTPSTISVPPSTNTMVTFENGRKVAALVEIAKAVDTEPCSSELVPSIKLTLNTKPLLVLTNPLNKDNKGPSVLNYPIELYVPEIDVARPAASEPRSITSDNVVNFKESVMKHHETYREVAMADNVQTLTRKPCSHNSEPSNPKEPSGNENTMTETVIETSTAIKPMKDYPDRTANVSVTLKTNNNIYDVVEMDNASLQPNKTCHTGNTSKSPDTPYAKTGGEDQSNMGEYVSEVGEKMGEDGENAYKLGDNANNGEENATLLEENVGKVETYATDDKEHTGACKMRESVNTVIENTNTVREETSAVDVQASRVEDIASQMGVKANVVAENTSELEENTYEGGEKASKLEDNVRKKGKHSTKVGTHASEVGTNDDELRENISEENTQASEDEGNGGEVGEYTSNVQENARKDRENLSEMGEHLIELGENYAKLEENYTKQGENATEQGENATEQGENATELGENATELRENVTELRENATEQGKNATEQGKNATEQGENATELGENATEQGENATEQGENATEQGETATELGEKLSKMGDYTSKLGENATKLGENGSEVLENTNELEEYTSEVDANYSEVGEITNSQEILHDTSVTGCQLNSSLSTVLLDSSIEGIMPGEEEMEEDEDAVEETMEEGEKEEEKADKASVGQQSSSSSTGQRSCKVGGQQTPDPSTSLDESLVNLSSESIEYNSDDFVW